jgi:hypothetical protein
MAKKPKPMTPNAQAAFEVHRDFGPSRTLKKTAELVGKSLSLMEKWSSAHNWSQLCAEHDHAELKEGLGRREITREHGTQRLVGMIDDAITVLHSVMMDNNVIPIKDRDGNQMTGIDGNPLFKPMVKASTRANCAEKILGIAGLVPVKRMVVEDKSAEALDAAAAVLRSMSPKQIDQFLDILDDEDKPGTKEPADA